MARPATTRRTRQAQKSQPGLSATFARVSKNAIVPKSEKEKHVAAKQLAVEKLEQAQQKPSPSPAAPTSTKNKRKRAESESGDEASNVVTHFNSFKKTKTQLPTPPRSTPERATPETVVPAQVQELVQIHKAFLKAFSLHRAHNGPSAPAELGHLLESVTRLYQKRVVSIVDVQRMLGLLELKGLAQGSSLIHHKSPFKLLISGLGANRRHLVEFVGYEKETRKNGKTVLIKISDLNEQALQTHYESVVSQVCSSDQLDGHVDAYPVLEFATGAQTVARQKKASEAKKLILDGRKPDLDFGRLSVKDDTERESTKQQTVKSRTLSLFDRVKAKQLANATVNVPSADALRRKHAVGRIAEVVEILRMKQQQKLRGLGTSGKASFAMQQIIGEVRVSLSIPMADDEIKMCLEILAKEVADGWCSIFELGQTRSVVLTGVGRSGIDVAAMVRT